MLGGCLNHLRHRHKPQFIAATDTHLQKFSVLDLRGINAIDLHESKDILAY